VCHGSNAKGAGEFGKYLTVVPPSLTTLSKENNGVFPLLEVVRIIDGRVPVPAHAGGDMPIWGNTFNRMAKAELGDPSDRQLLVNMRITALADYLEGLQEK
jgi:hypothetical protein